MSIGLIYNWEFVSEQFKKINNLFCYNMSLADCRVASSSLEKFLKFYLYQLI